MPELLELSSSACAHGTRRRRLHLWGVCDPGCAATREKNQSCPATGMCQKRCQSPPSVSPPGARHQQMGMLGINGVLKVRDCEEGLQAARILAGAEFEPAAGQAASVDAALPAAGSRKPRVRPEKSDPASRRIAAHWQSRISTTEGRRRSGDAGGGRIVSW